LAYDAGVTMTAPLSLAAGSRFGPYEIIREIGIGRNAVYYQAAGGVALELFWSFSDDGGWLAMRVDEARLATIFAHPNLARLYAGGSVDGQLFLAHEYIDGESVREIRHRHNRAAWGPDAAVAVALGVTAGLGYLHDSTTRDGKPLHWVHRKLTPSSVFITRDGAVKLTDFAMSLTTGASRPPGETDFRVSPYWTPEQVLGRPLDRRCDLFALGTVLYELTTTRRPFDGEGDFSMLLAIRDGKLAPPSSLVAGYSPRLERIVVRALERHRDRRYQTAGELEDDLRELVRVESLDVSARVLASRMAPAP
jgi:serine/threonine protein kinase